MSVCRDPRCDWHTEDHEDEFPCAQIIDSWGNTRDLETK